MSKPILLCGYHLFYKLNIKTVQILKHGATITGLRSIVSTRSIGTSFFTESSAA